jgi:hypothetical protein
VQSRKELGFYAREGCQGFGEEEDGLFAAFEAEDPGCWGWVVFGLKIRLV